MTSNLQDKNSIMQVLGYILHNPDVLGNDREFPIGLEDFPELFHKAIFTAMNNLYRNGAEKITVPDIDAFLSKHEKAYLVFEQNQGVDYLLRVEEMGIPENFKLHYNRMRKYTFLRECVNNGIDISEILDLNTIDTKENQAQQERFDQLQLDDMVAFMEEKMIGLRDKFLFDSNNTGGKLGNNAVSILQELKEGTSYGLPMGSELYTAATMGAIKGRLHLVSAPSGVGKTRWNLKNVIEMGVPVYYNREKQQWMKRNITGEGVLYIGTELLEEEVVVPVLCSIAGVDETDAKEQKLNEAEWKRMDMAAQILERSPIYFEQMLDFDLADIEHAITKHVNKHNVNYVIHDYVHDSVKLMASFNKINKSMQEHQRLLQVMTRLKELAQKFDVFILTSTQLNSNYKEEGGLDETSIAGAKSMVNKVDIGAIMVEFSKTDEKILQSIVNEHADEDGTFGGILPNVTINIFKSRGTKWKLIRIWTHFDRGTLDMTDVFVTDYKGKIITELQPVEIMFESDYELETDTLPIGVQRELKMADSIEDDALMGEMSDEFEI